MFQRRIFWNATEIVTNEARESETLLANLSIIRISPFYKWAGSLRL